MIASPSSPQIQEAVEVIRREVESFPSLALTLGSGLGEIARLDPLAASLATADIPGWPRSTVTGHAGRLLFGGWKGVPIAVVVGRSHRYEGYTPAQVTFGVRVLHALGARVMIFTNAAGAIAHGLVPGDLMLATDHLNLIGRRGLFTHEELAEGAAHRRVGGVHDVALGVALVQAGARAGVAVRRGILFATHGPSYETAAEVRMAARMGASAVCMSTVNEAELAAALGCRVAVLSCLTNRATGLSERPLSHDEVTEVAGRAATRLRSLLEEYLAALSGTSEVG